MLLAVSGIGPRAARHVGDMCRLASSAASILVRPVPARCQSTSATLRSSPSHAPSISVHKGLKIQAAICVERPPTRVLEPDYKTRWNAFRETWERRTNNDLTVEDEIVFMRFHFHFLEGGSGSKRAAASLSSGQQGSLDGDASSSLLPQQAEAAGGLDALLSQEGLADLSFPEQGKRRTRRRRVQKQVAMKVDDSDLRSLERLSGHSLYLLVRLPGAAHWTFPKADRAHGEPMRETLLKLCARQLGAKFSPYIVGACPFTYRKRRSGHLPGIEGRKIFYYRARLTPGMVVAPPDDSLVEDWAWCSRDELSSYLGDSEWHTVRHGLPIDGA